MLFYGWYLHTKVRIHVIYWGAGVSRNHPDSFFLPFLKISKFRRVSDQTAYRPSLFPTFSCWIRGPLASTLWFCNRLFCWYCCIPIMLLVRNKQDVVSFRHRRSFSAAATRTNTFYLLEERSRSILTKLQRKLFPVAPHDFRNAEDCLSFWKGIGFILSCECLFKILWVTYSDQRYVLTEGV